MERLSREEALKYILDSDSNDDGSLAEEDENSLTDEECLVEGITIFFCIFYCL